jgi:hypothetical protein
MKLQKLGGYAAIACVCAYAAYLVANISAYQRFGDFQDPVKMMSAALTAPTWIYAIHLLNIACCILAFIFFLALHERMQVNAPNLTRISLISMTVCAAVLITYSIAVISGFFLSILPTQDNSAYRAFAAMCWGLGEMGNHAYGWACLLIGIAIVRTRAFSRVSGWIFFISGILLIPQFIIPKVPLFGSLLFGISAVWVGIAMLRQKPSQPASKEMAAAR